MRDRGIVTSAVLYTDRWPSSLTLACNLHRTVAWSQGPVWEGWEVKEHSGLLHHVGQEGGTEEVKPGKGETLAGQCGAALSPH